MFARAAPSQVVLWGRSSGPHTRPSQPSPAPHWPHLCVSAFRTGRTCSWCKQALGQTLGLQVPMGPAQVRGMGGGQRRAGTPRSQTPPFHQPVPDRDRSGRALSAQARSKSSVTRGPTGREWPCPPTSSSPSCLRYSGPIPHVRTAPQAPAPHTLLSLGLRCLEGSGNPARMKRRARVHSPGPSVGAVAPGRPRRVGRGQAVPRPLGEPQAETSDPEGPRGETKPHGARGRGQLGGRRDGGQEPLPP